MFNAWPWNCNASAIDTWLSLEVMMYVVLVAGVKYQYSGPADPEDGGGAEPNSAQLALRELNGRKNSNVGPVILKCNGRPDATVSRPGVQPLVVIYVTT